MSDTWVGPQDVRSRGKGIGIGFMASIQGVIGAMSGIQGVLGPMSGIWG